MSKEEEINIDGLPHINTHIAAKRLQVSVRRVQQFIEAGRLPTRQIGREHFIKVSDLKLVKERKTGRPSKKTAAKKGTKKASKK